MAKALLGHERTLIGGIAESGKWLQRVQAHRAPRRRSATARCSTTPASAAASRASRCATARSTMANLRTLAAAQLGRAPGAESSILKIVGTELYQEATELAMDAMGHDALGWFDAPSDALPEHERWVARQFNYLRAATIYGGSNEIQKNIIAKQILRLPGA